MFTRRTALKSLAGVGAVAAMPAMAEPVNPAAIPEGGAVSVRDKGVRGDGERHEAAALQDILDETADKGGGAVIMPPGRYILEKSLLIPSAVHLIGHGMATILTGYRPDGVNGYALLANQGIVTAEGYEGAGGFSVRNLAIDSPRTNGIVLVHAQNGYFSHIYGVDAHHHHFDIAGSRNIVTENLFLTGRSGTAPYQIDGSPYNNNIWDGETNVAPIRDETPNDGIFLSNSVIRPTNRPNHGIHLHRQGGKNIFVHNVLIEHLENGVYRDADCGREDVFISNVVIRDMSNHALNFRPTDTPDRRVTFENISAVNCGDEAAIDYHGCRNLAINGATIEQIDGDGVRLRDVDTCNVSGLTVWGRGSGAAVRLAACKNISLSTLTARNTGETIHMDGCANVRYSGAFALDEDGGAIPVNITGESGLVPWETS